jgi:two-component system sensor histidine kinase/response regulator
VTTEIALPRALREFFARRGRAHRHNGGLSETEQRLAGIIDSAMDAIISVDEQQRIVIFNSAAERMFVCTAKDAVGRALETFIPPRLRRTHSKHVEQFAKTGVTSRSMWRPGVLLGLRANGQEFPIEATISQVQVGERKFFTAIVRDVTERKAIEDKLQRALDDAQEANRTREEFLAVISHELRTPLNAIIGYAQLMESGIPERVPNPALKHVERVQIASRHLLSLIEEILTFSRIESGKEAALIEPVMIKTIITELLTPSEPLARSKGLALKVETPGCENVGIETDHKKVVQILLNLLGNAIKFTEEGEVGLLCAVTEGYVSFSVTDTGIGIAPENLDHIFEEFWRVERDKKRRTGGTGLGLAVARRLAHLLGGQITASSRLGEGSAFTLRLPRSHPGGSV